jgi:hypothetical protein
MWIDQFKATDTALVGVCIDWDQHRQDDGCSEAKPVYDWRTQLIHVVPPYTPVVSTGAAGGEVARVLLIDRADGGER